MILPTELQVRDSGGIQICDKFVPHKVLISPSHVPKRASICHTTLQAAHWVEAKWIRRISHVGALQWVSNEDAYACAYAYCVEVQLNIFEIIRNLVRTLMLSPWLVIYLSINHGVVTYVKSHMTLHYRIADEVATIVVWLDCFSYSLTVKTLANTCVFASAHLHVLKFDCKATASRQLCLMALLQHLKVVYLSIFCSIS